MNAPHIYLDNNATTRPYAECIEAVYACMRESYGNPSSKHGFGDQARQLVNEARAQVARLLGAQVAEVVFTSGATEANHMAIRGALALQPERRHLVVSAVEHPSVLMLARHLESRGVRLTVLPVDASGCISLSQLQAALNEDTALVSLMWANNETGVLQPVEQAAALARARGILFHSDAVQAVGKVPVNIAAAPVDMLSLAAHKFHGPLGVGALFIRKGLKLPPLLFGHQERHRRGGTENVPGIVGCGVACELAAGELAASAARITALRNRLEAGLLARVPFASVNGANAPRLPNTSSITFGGLPAEMILQRLERERIYASQGAACAAGATEPSHVLLAMGLAAEAALATVRFSLSHDSTEAKIDRVLAVMPAIVGELAGMAA